VAFLAAQGVLADVGSLLDVGAGSGFSSIYYPERIRVVACDYAAGMLAGNPTREKLVSSAYGLPFADHAFDAVSCWELLHHLDDPVAAVREMLRVARRKVVIFEPNRINPGHICLGLMRENERQSLKFTPGHLRRLVTAAGGRIAFHKRGGLLFPNITPLPLARMLVRLPFRVPVVAISQLMILHGGGVAVGRG
jgi:SAM-dependent methyltransferase